MEYFKSGLKSVLGSTQPGAQPTGAETVSVFRNPPDLLLLTSLLSVKTERYEWHMFLGRTIGR